MWNTFRNLISSPASEEDDMDTDSGRESVTDSIVTRSASLVSLDSTASQPLEALGEVTTYLMCIFFSLIYAFFQITLTDLTIRGEIAVRCRGNVSDLLFDFSQ